MSSSRAAQLPAWVNGRVAVWGCGLLSLALVLLGAGFLWLVNSQEQQAESEHCALYARTLEAQSNQALSSSDLALQGLTRSLDALAPGPGQEIAANGLLSQALTNLPFVRSFSVLDAGGRVLASSNPDNLGRTLELARLLPADGGQGLGALMAGRDLAELQTSLRSNSAYLLPFSKAVRGPVGARHLIAVINPDYFANLFERQLGQSEHRVGLFNLHGQLIASNRGLSLAPGSLLPAHEVFRSLLKSKESGSYSTASGLDGEPALGSYRITRDHPWVLIVERSQNLLALRFAKLAQVVGLSVLAGLALMALLGALAWRALAAYDLARQELQTAHADLARKEREQSLLISNVQELMFRTDAEGRLQFINHVDFLGKQGSLLGTQFPNLIDPRDQARARSLFHPGNALLNLPIALRLQGQQGRQRVLEVSVTAVRQDNGQIGGFVGFAIDVTEREDARQRLQAQLDFTARLIDVCPIPIFAKDLGLRFVMVNQAWSEMAGVDKNLALGRRLSELRPAALALQAEEQDSRLLSSGGSEQLELQEDGRDLLTHRTVFTDAQGRIAGVLGSAIDISRFVEAERQTREARDAAERANNVKSEFVTHMSHELRTPLQSIIGFSELGVGRSGETPRLQDMFARIHAASQRMLSLVDKLLDLSRLESSAGQLNLQVQDLSPLLIGLSREFQAQAEQAGVQLRLQLPPQQLRAALDPARLQQALRNVLDNALRFSPKGSTVELSASQDAAGLCLAVRDHGPGIPPAELELVFAPFVQGRDHKPSAGNIGLGLAISRRIMAAHGGSISAHNHAQGGCLFELRLPSA